jgi:hypothetical protein
MYSHSPLVKRQIAIAPIQQAAIRLNYREKAPIGSSKTLNADLDIESFSLFACGARLYY